MLDVQLVPLGEYTAGWRLAAEAAREEGMRRKAAEFRETGAELYVP